VKVKRPPLLSSPRFDRTLFIQVDHILPTVSATFDYLRSSSAIQVRLARRISWHYIPAFQVFVLWFFLSECLFSAFVFFTSALQIGFCSVPVDG
jgi:hypothetical protein